MYHTIYITKLKERYIWFYHVPTGNNYQKMRSYERACGSQKLLGERLEIREWKEQEG